MDCKEVTAVCGRGFLQLKTPLLPEPSQQDAQPSRRLWVVRSGIVLETCGVGKNRNTRTAHRSLLTQKALQFSGFFSEPLAQACDVLQPPPIPPPGEDNQRGGDKTDKTEQNKHGPAAPPTERCQRRSIEGENDSRDDRQQPRHPGLHV